MNKVFTPKQENVISLFKKDKLRRINLLAGSVRSGKTYISLVLWALWIATMPSDKSYMMVGKTLTTLKRNCLELLENLVGTNSFTYSISKKEGILFGRKIYFESVNDKRCENKIRGMTLQGAYCDELSLFDEDFFSMLLSRLSEKDAKLFATTNPDNPNHWLYKKYIKRKDELDLLVLNFLIDDNVFLDKKYIENLKNEYSGVFYDRFILGKWKAAEGVVYPEFSNNSENFIIDEVDKNEIMFASIGVDFGGNKSAHAFICNGFLKEFKGVVTLGEFYLKEKISPKMLENHFVDFVKKMKCDYKIYDVFCDSAETTLIEGLILAGARENLGVDIRLAKKGKITERIRFFNLLMGCDMYKVLKNCKNVCNALESAVWDMKSSIDKRLDDGSVNIDSLDALEYATEEYMKDLICVCGK